MFSLAGKEAVVTGGGSGIGRAVAAMLAGQGAIVRVLDINGGQVEEVVKEITGKGGKASGMVTDVSDQGQVLEQFKGLSRADILVNSAGVSHIGILESTTEADFDRLYRVNVKGVYNCMLAAIPLMKKSGGGVILNMCSVAAIVGIPERFAYSMTKGAVMSMTLSVARDYLKDHIRCNSISPGRVHTPFVDGYIRKTYPGREEEMFDKLAKTQPIGRMGKPDEIAGLILYLCSEEASFITGCDYPIDGGFIKLNTP
jgi:2-keto-3-deoxy-L-fuconate dehydrogenase